MTEQEINIAIAEVCGWRKCTRNCGCKQPHWDHPDDIPFGGHGERIYELPDWCEDLNEMRDALQWLFAQGIIRNGKPLDRYQTQEEYRRHLLAVVRKPNPDLEATAKEQAIAFLRTLRLWKP